MLVAALAGACATSSDSLSGDPASPVEDSPEAKRNDAWAAHTLDELEERLEQADALEVAFVIESEGAVTSHLEGTLRWTSAGVVSLTATGEFAGQAQDFALQADAETLTILVAGESRWSGPRPAKLVEALVIGLTRQGLLHNLAVVSGGLPPDHADGAVREWVEAVAPQLGPAERFGADEATPLEFQITVEDQLVGRASVWLDPRGLPLERHQTVNFPEGQMRVTERYTSFTVSP